VKGRIEINVVKMLYLVGLGLADEKDITVRGLEVVKNAERVYLEAYTSILLVDKEKLVRYSYNGARNVLYCKLSSKLTDLIVY
jgi:diphthamide biosynthesis methyltransferase